MTGAFEREMRAIEAGLVMTSSRARAEHNQAKLLRFCAREIAALALAARLGDGHPDRLREALDALDKRAHEWAYQ